MRINTPVQSSSDNTKRYTYRLDRSINADQPFVFAAERSVGYYGSKQLRVEYRVSRREGIVGDFTKNEAIALRDILVAALAEWDDNEPV